MMTKKYTGVLWSILALVITVTACRKTEFMPQPEGSQIPYQADATQSIAQLLAASSAKIFYGAWQKSSMKARLEAKGKNAKFTVFVPSDEAFIAAGITPASIAQMAVKDVDSLLMFYTSDKMMAKEQLREYSIPLKTMREQPGLYVNFYESELNNGQSYDLYFHKLYLAVKGQELLINGKSVGKLNYQPATDGGLYFMDKTVECPSKTVEQALKADGRFNFFLALLQLSDEAYYEKLAMDLEPLFGYQMSREEIMESFSYLIDRKQLGPQWGGIMPPPYPGFVGVNIVRSTLFVPTDQAFKNAGFQSVAEMLAFNQQRGNVHFDELSFQPKGAYPTDSILNYHYDWGRMFAPKDPSWGMAAGNATVFYSNDLRPEFLNDYIINIGGNAGSSVPYQMPFSFQAAAAGKQLKVKNSTFPAANIVEADINTLNGPIHVVDHLLVPPGFKLN